MERVVLHGYVDLFLDYLHREKQSSRHTRASYLSDLKQLFNFWEAAETKDHQTICLKTILKRYRTLLTSQKHRPSSIARKLSCFNSFILYLSQQGLTQPLTLVRPTVILKYPVTISQKELTFLLNEVEHTLLPTPTPYRDKSILALLYATGMRCSEIISLRLKDINFEEHSIIITPKRGAQRVVYFGARAEELLNLYNKHERQAPHGHDFVFLNYKQEPLTTRSIQRICSMFGNALKEKKPLTPHILRHSFAVHLLEKGVDIPTVQQLLGHAVRISTERYIR